MSSCVHLSVEDCVWHASDYLVTIRITKEANSMLNFWSSKMQPKVIKLKQTLDENNR